MERGEKGYYCVQKWNGSRWIYLTYNQTFYTDTDGQKYIAYCLCPGLPGVGYVSGEKETYKVNITELMDNDVIWRVLKNGYPNKSVAELGVETSDDAYFATMQAINAILRGYTLEQAKELYAVGQFAINGESLEDVKRRGSKTLDAMFKLIDIGLNGNETRSQFLNISIRAESSFQKENDDYYSQIFSVQSSSEIAEYNVDKMDNLPKGSYIANMANIEKQNFKDGEKFKIMIPTKNIVNDIKGKISIKARQKNYPIYYGASSIEGYQDYALCNNSYSEVYAESEVYIQADKSKLILTKVEKGTNKTIEGVKFQVTSTDGTVSTISTDENGKITIANQRPGTVSIKELSTVENYKLNADEIKVELKYNEVKEIKIENELKKGKIKVIKVDSDNNEVKIPGVIFKIYDENGDEVCTLETDENGEAVTESLPINHTYTVKETQTLETYELTEEPQTVTLKEDEISTITFENKLKKGSIKVVKVDADDDKVTLANVKFHLLDEENNFIMEGETNRNGECNFDNVVIGNYKIIEVSTAEGYDVSNDEFKVEVVHNEQQELLIRNKKKKVEEKPKEEAEKPNEDKPEIKIEQPKEEEVQRELPKTGENSSMIGITGNLILVGIYNAFMVLKKGRKFL